MKKFENTLIISDIDGTLVDYSFKLSEENKAAARYFMDNGGTFTYATGRQMPVAQSIIDQLFPNAPVICYNGAAIYDYSKNKYLWFSPLDTSVFDIIPDIVKNCPEANIEINTPDGLFLITDIPGNMKRYKQLSELFKKVDSASDVPQPWLKIVCAMSDDYMPVVRGYFENQPFFKDFQFSQSASWLYELLPFGVNKGTALPRLKELLDGKHKIIAIGDNENDIEFLKAADIGFAVADGSPLLLDRCENRTVALHEHALVDIVEKLDKGLI
ncbi:MAG: HAD family phosphatase [Clostridia bacterium]|nr:HAD family phosphatase [Clostridia bacterium]